MVLRKFLLLLVFLALAAAAGYHFLGLGGSGGIAYSDAVRRTPVLRGVMSPVRDLTEDDLVDLADWNVTLVRFQIMRNWLQTDTDRDIAEYDAWFNSRLDNLEAMLPVARRLGIRFVVDFHTPPGGRADGNVMRMFDESDYAEHFLAVWRRIATRFLSHPDKSAIWAYDIINEPIESPAAAARGAGAQLILAAARAIREIDPDIPLIATPLIAGGSPVGFREFEPMPIDNVIYQLHMYSPFSFTHQFVLPELSPPPGGGGGHLEYPGLAEGEMWNKARLRRELQPVRDFQIDHGARIYAGEFSAIAWAPGADAWLADCVSLFEEYGWDWSYHSFREWDGFSLEHEGELPDQFRPSRDNARLRAMLRAWEKK